MKTEELEKSVGKLKTQVAKAREKATDERNDPRLRELKKMLKRRQRQILKAKYSARCAAAKKKKED